MGRERRGDTVALWHGRRGDTVALRHGRRGHAATVDSVGADVDLADLKPWPAIVSPPSSPRVLTNILFATVATPAASARASPAFPLMPRFIVASIGFDAVTLGPTSSLFGAHRRSSPFAIHRRAAPR
uniref:Uncharacterized protein n=1 Tax=Oryza rufipogon TaxID=4529 RepID=A0A0E0QJ74_ORYRU